MTEHEAGEGRGKSKTVFVLDRGGGRLFGHRGCSKETAHGINDGSCPPSIRRLLALSPTTQRLLSNRPLE